MLESREESKSTRSDDVTSESRSPGGKLPILEAALADLRREVQACHMSHREAAISGVWKKYLLVGGGVNQAFICK